MSLDTITPALRERLLQLSKAASAVSDAARKAGFELHSQRIQFPQAAKLVIEDLESDAHRLSALLNPDLLIPADAHNQTRRVDSLDAGTTTEIGA